MKSIVILSLLFVLVAGSVSWSAGRDLFVAKCGECHKKGGSAVVINPADKAAVVWKKYFKRRRHPVDFSSSISDGQLEEILKYLEEHAADSDQPAEAVIPK